VYIGVDQQVTSLVARSVGKRSTGQARSRGGRLGDNSGQPGSLAGSASPGRATTARSSSPRRVPLHSSSEVTGGGDILAEGRGDLLRYAALQPVMLSDPVGVGLHAPNNNVTTPLRGLRTPSGILPSPPGTGSPAELAIYYDRIRGMHAAVIAQRVRTDLQRVAASLAGL
jgi:hypothetical protein